jgi:hypothetical protein
MGCKSGARTSEFMRIGFRLRPSLAPHKENQVLRITRSSRVVPRADVTVTLYQYRADIGMTLLEKSGGQCRTLSSLDSKALAVVADLLP